MRVRVSTKLQVVPATVAVPSWLVPEKITTLSPTANSALREPLKFSEVSSVRPPEATTPWTKPTSSLMAVIVAMVVGATVSIVTLSNSVWT